MSHLLYLIFDMKPTNNIQKEIVSLSKKLKPITERQIQYAYTHCFEPFAKRTAKGICTCSDCAHSWKDTLSYSCSCNLSALRKKTQSLHRQKESVQLKCILYGHYSRQWLSGVTALYSLCRFQSRQTGAVFNQRSCSEMADTKRENIYNGTEKICVSFLLL